LYATGAHKKNRLHATSPATIAAYVTRARLETFAGTREGYGGRRRAS
jgi:hypothetical protein